MNSIYIILYRKYDSDDYYNSCPCISYFTDIKRAGKHLEEKGYIQLTQNEFTKGPFNAEIWKLDKGE